MGKIQSHVKEKVNQIFSEERKTELRRGLSYYSERAWIFKEIALLSKDQLQFSICELNSMLEKSSSAATQNVVFHSRIPEGIDWKKSVRILCFQLDKDKRDPVLTRYMNIIQFWTLRSEIVRQIGKKLQIEDANQFQFVDHQGEAVSPDEVVQTSPHSNEAAGFCTGYILDRASELSMEEIECCICMEKKSDVSLSCAHCFCKQCIDSWAARQPGDEQTCPLCRHVLKDEDEYWEMTDIPDKDEMHNYVVSLASGIQ